MATRNPHKLEEVRAILSDFPVEILPLTDFPPVDFPEENEATYEKNALKKAVHAARFLEMPALADDSGLEVEALAGRLGVHSSRFLGEQTPYTIKNAEVLELLKEAPAGRRKARFVCAAAAAFPDPDGKTRAARGEIRGIVAFKPSGKKGFGYDPIFFLPEWNKTMAELSFEEKNKISHRANAFRKLLKTISL